MNINATLFVQMVVFFIGCYITMKYIWPPLLKAIEGRQQKIAAGLAAAEKGNNALNEAQAKGKEIEAQARARASVIVSDGEFSGCYALPPEDFSELCALLPENAMANRP